MTKLHNIGLAWMYSTYFSVLSGSTIRIYLHHEAVVPVNTYSEMKTYAYGSPLLIFACLLYAFIASKEGASSTVSVEHFMHSLTHMGYQKPPCHQVSLLCEGCVHVWWGEEWRMD